MTGRALGLDLAWSDRHPSAACALDGRGRVIDEAPLGDDAAVVAWVRRHLAARVVLAADIPLAVPNETGMRPCERELHRAYGRRHAGPYPTSRAHCAGLGRLRGEDLAGLLGHLGFGDPWSGNDRVLLEVYPHPGLVEVFGLDERLAYKKGRVAARRAGLQRLASLLASLDDPPLLGPTVEIDGSLGGRALKATEDRLDARFCAWIALVWARHGTNRVRLFGDRADGHIAVPRPAATPR